MGSQRRSARHTPWSYRAKRGIFVLGLLIVFGSAGLYVMSQ